MDMNMLLSKLDERLNQQTITITNNVTKNVMAALDEKMNRLLEANSLLNARVEHLEEKIRALENSKRRNNIVFFGVQENERGKCELVQNIKDIIEEAGVHIDCQEIATAFRLGKKGDKTRPVLVEMNSSCKKQLIFMNKKNLPAHVFVNDDFPKEVLEKRKQLLPKLEEERKKGNTAYIKYDKLIIKENNSKEKRKRDSESTSPEGQPRKQQTTGKAKGNQLNAYEMMKTRGNSGHSQEK